MDLKTIGDAFIKEMEETKGNLVWRVQVIYYRD